MRKINLFKDLAVRKNRYKFALAFALVFILYSIFYLLTPAPAPAATMGKSPQVIGTTTCSVGLSCGLVGYWTFDGDKMKNNVADSSGLGNNGYMSGFGATSTAVAQGKVGQGLKFDGVNDYVNIGVPASLNLNNNYTVSAWVYIRSSRFYGSLVRLSSNSAIDNKYDKYRISPQSDRIRFNTGDGTTGDTDDFMTTIPLRVWTFVTCTLSNDNVKACYKNGALINTAANSVDTSLLTPIAGWIGRTGSVAERHFDGLLDDIRIYNRALSATEIRQLYNLGAGVKFAASQNVIGTTTCSVGLSCGLVGYWTFDGKDMLNGKALDMSGRGNNGSPVNIATSTFYAQGKIGQGLKFSGSSYVSMLSDSIGASAATVSLWINPIIYTSPDFNYPSLVNNTTKFNLQIQSARVNFSSDGVTYANSAASSLPLNKWTFVTVTRTSSGVANIYINGVLSGAANQSSGTPASGSPILLGGYNLTSSKYSGLLDDLRVYNRALSPLEVRQLYNLGK